jgi:hypothetical protein
VILRKNVYFNRLSTHILFLFIVVSTSGCTGSAEKKQEIIDTATINMPAQTQTKLAPGTTKIEGSVIKMIKSNNHYNCIIRVEKVLGYGMSAKPLPKGREISVYLLTTEENLIKLLSEGTMEQKYELTVEQEQMVDNKLEWRVLKVNKIHFEQ